MSGMQIVPTSDTPVSVFLVHSRSGHEACAYEFITQTSFLACLVNAFNQAVADFPEPFRGQVLRGWPFEVSSSAIRERLRLGQAIDGLVPSAVAESLQNDNPYKSEQ